MSELSLSCAQESGDGKSWPQIPGYRVQRVLHQGSTATVYLATQEALDRLVAIKVLHTPKGEVEQAHVPWQQEASVRAKLAHPHIVNVYDAGRVGDDFYFVMEYVNGPSLRERMQRGRPWRIRPALAVLQAVAEALEYIHARGLLHLDLKPENVLLSESGQAKVTDFSISLQMPEEKTAPVFWGTCDYCAPEQRFGLGVDRRADVFSLAVLAYEMLTGYLPGRVYVSARRYNKLLPSGVDKVLARGLARDKEERYDSAMAFYHDLVEALLNYRQHPIWGSLAALGIALLVAVPFLLQRSGWLLPRPQTSVSQPAASAPNFDTANATGPFRQ